MGRQDKWEILHAVNMSIKFSKTVAIFIREAKFIKQVNEGKYAIKLPPAIQCKALGMISPYWLLVETTLSNST